MQTSTTVDHGYLRQLVFGFSQNVLDPSRDYLFETRLAKLLRNHGMTQLDELVHHLKTRRNPALECSITEAMTINETSFFRDGHPFELLRAELLPKLIDSRRRARSLRFWSAACSTGQEAYSLAMMLLEEKLASWNIQILGTDYSEAVVKRAQAASFQQIEVNRGLPTSLLIKYFTRSGMDWKLSETVRRMANFRTIDLRNSMSTLGPFDLAFCRNVMIYFDDKTKRKIMKQLHGTLFRGGWLLLGGAETIFGLDDLFERKNIGSATVYIAR